MTTTTLEPSAIHASPPMPQHMAIPPKASDKPVLVDVEGRPTPAGWRKISELLAQPMATRTFRGRGGLQMEYITARQVQRRLDQVVGPGNWATQIRIVRADHPVAVAVGLAIFGVWKWDVGYSNSPDADDPEDKSYEIEPLKAAVSDGLKRAAVQWGVGRWLYPEMRPQSE